MNKALLVTFAAIAALASGLQAQEGSLDSFSRSLQQPSAVTVPEVSAPAAVEMPNAGAAAGEREWLVLVFINGVNDLGILGFANSDINEMEAVGSTERMSVVVEYGILGEDGSGDRNLQFQRGSSTIFVTRDADPSRITSPVVFTSNDADMGSEANLVRFVKRALRNGHRARKTALVVWNHGAGRLGISYDDVSKNHMEVDALGRALGQIKQALGKKIDVFATDACLMQMASVAYEFRDSAEVIVGSEEVIPGNGYPYTPILTQLATNPGMDAEQLGRTIVDAYGASYPTDATLSAIRTSALDGFKNALNNWVGAVRSDPQAFAAATDAALVDSVSRFAYKDSKDLIDYLDKVEARLADSRAVKDAGAAVREQVRRMLVANVAKPARGNKYTAANGLAIYIPDLRYASANYERMAFAADSLWDDFLLDMMSERLK